ncbi:MAG: transglutaminase domain-containing protein [Actinobacteria bacterium]|nr:transglutaminase domain-containing protein [Actinomycetota bacterium]
MISAVALAALTAVAAASFVRVFTEPSSVVPALVGGLLAHVIPRLADRRWSPLATGIALVGSAGLAAAWTVAPSTTVLGIPTGETFQVLGERFSDGFGALRDARVPIGPHSGIVLVAAAGAFCAGLAADWVAFRARAVLSAAIPAATLFTLTATLGEDRLEAPLTAAFVVAALLFLLAHAPAQAGEVHAWFASETRTLGPAAVLRAGLPIVLIAAVAGPLLGPRLPQARSAGLIDLAPSEGGPRTRVTVSPLVDIRDRLTQQPPVDVFTVRAGRPAYWRLAALETYDGEIWSSLADYQRAGDELPADSTAVPTVELTQDYRISGLAQFWLPAAYRPASIELPGTRVNRDSLTLLTEAETAQGLAYRVTSQVPNYAPPDLASETGRVPEGIRPFLEVPPLPEPVEGLAREVTAGHRTVYDKALALQDWFRTEFAYSEEVPAGHSGDRLVDFLTTSRAGFCEQFSASFAVMARSLGIPSRVAVGFTPGALDAATSTFKVTSAEAHAWPEIYIDPYGWVAFEPTPNRFNPSPANHTGTFNPEAQQAPPDAVDPEATATTVVPGGADGATAGSSAPEEEPADDRTAPTAEGGSSWVRRVALVGGLIILLAALGLLGMFSYRRQRRARRLVGLDPRGSILLAWNDVVARLRVDGVPIRDSFTPNETALVGGAHKPGAFESLSELRTLVDAAAYSPVDLGPGDATTAWATASDVLAVLDEDEPTTRRLRRRLLTGV